MANSVLEQTLMDLEARLKAETELSARDNNVTASPGPSGRPGGARSFNNGALNRRPNALGDILGTPTRTRKPLDLPASIIQQPKQIDSLEIENKMKEIMKMNGILNINNRRYQTDMKDLEHLGELGNGTCGQVVKMLHQPSQTLIAVKQMRRSGNGEENKRIIMDLDVVLKSHDCHFIVRCLGCFITESDVWICMELMSTCFDRLLKRLRISVPEPICGKITLSTVRALHYLKETHGVIHRDVKPSNILLDERGNIKLCDFGISGRLVDSKARTKNAGCAAYMAPERIEPPDPRKPDYDIRADVWSLGITLVELATGEFPYKDCKCDFEVLSRVLKDDPPCLPNDPVRFSPEFQNFVSLCLTKDYNHRPKYRKLLEHPFLRRYENVFVDVAEWYRKVVETCGVSSPALSLKSVNNTKAGISGRTSVSLSSPQPFRRRLHTPETDKDGNSLGKFYQHSYSRSSSISPNRYYVPAADNPTKSYSSEEAQSHSNATQKITSYIKYHLGVGNNSAPPSPPPRLNRNIDSSSPRLFRRVSAMTNQEKYQSNQNFNSNNNHRLHSNPFAQYQSQATSNSQNHNNTNPFTQYGNQFHANSHSNQFQTTHQSRFLSQNSQSNFSAHSNTYDHSPTPLRRNLESSPCLPRRYVSPSPPMPPPRRLSECNSVPSSPLNLRAKYPYTPEPTRRTLNLDL